MSNNVVNKVNSNGNLYYISDIEARENIKSISSTLEDKVDKVEGKELSTNDLTNDLKTEYDAAVVHSKKDHARSDASAVAKSNINGNIIVNETEVNVYTHPEGTNPHGTTKADLGLENVGNFKAVSTVAEQGLTHTEKENARANIGAGTSSFSGVYNDLTGKPEALPASDVYEWAKEATKPSYTAEEVGLGNVGNFKAVSTVEDQELTDIEKENARTNINAQVAGSYAASEHTHVVDEITDFPNLGTASSKDVAESGNANTTQVVMGNDTRLSDARIASDVYDWAKAATKPSYTAEEVGLGNVGNFKAVSTVANQGLSEIEQISARNNINAQVAGSYAASEHTHVADEITDLADWAKEDTKPSYTAEEVGLGNVGNFKAVSTVEDQELTDTEKSNARTNIGLGTASTKDVASSGDASTSQVVMGNDTRLSDARKASDVYDWAKAATKPSYTSDEVGALSSTLKGAANGVAELDSTGKVPASQLPAYVDDVVEGYLNNSKFYKESSYTTEITGETGKIYIDLSTSKTYRWSGSAFVVISETLALGETSSTAYRGDRGAVAYTHSQSAHAPSNAQANVIETIKVNGTALTPSSKAVNITTTTYTLTKSGNIIKLSGSDGSSYEVSAGGTGGVAIGTSAPSDTGLAWIDTGNGGVLKYYNGSAWTTTKSVWG